MTDGTPPNDTRPERLTVAQGAQALEGLLDPTILGDESEDKPTPAKKTVAKKVAATPDESEQPEPLDPEEQSEDVEAVTEDTDVDPDVDPDTDEDIDEDEVEDEPVTKEPPKFRVKVRGEEVEVTQDELLNGYSRQADYTRSKQELATLREKFEKEEVPVVRERAVKYAEGLKQIEEALVAMTPAEPDWDKLAVESPETFANDRAMWQLQQERINAVRAERERAATEVQKDQMEQRRKLVTAESEKLLTLIPAWKDAEVAKKEKAEIVKYAKELGFSDDDLSQVVLANAMLLLRNSYLYEKSQKAKPALIEKINRVKAATPGPRDERRPEVTKQTRRLQRLAKTHSIKDAASVLENMPGLLD
jgi:hypothetical protein